MGDTMREIAGMFGPDGGKGPYLHQGAQGAFSVYGGEGEKAGFVANGQLEPNGDQWVRMEASRVVPVGAANVPRSWASLACAYFGQPCTD